MPTPPQGNPHWLTDYVNRDIQRTLAQDTPPNEKGRDQRSERNDADREQERQSEEPEP